jgi:hypothetical protein
MQAKFSNNLSGQFNSVLASGCRMYPDEWSERIKLEKSIELRPHNYHSLTLKNDIPKVPNPDTAPNTNKLLRV